MQGLKCNLAELTERPVAIFGRGVSGQAVMKLLASYNIEYVCYDSKGENGSLDCFGSSDASEHKLVIYSPGFPMEHPWLKAALEAGCVCMSELDFASHYWKGKIVAITGTNGKTTLAEFLAFSLRYIGIGARAVGNNGFPLSGLLIEENAEDFIAVCEVSSFQGETLQHMHPDAVLWTNFTEDHLDRHSDMKDYFLAKWNLVERLREPAFFLGASVFVAAEQYGVPMPTFAHVDCGTRKVCKDLSDDSAFAGLPQRENLRLAHLYWLRQGYSSNELCKAASHFPPRKHRLNKLGEIGGVSFWNDSKATNFASALAALESFSRPALWIGGGKSKGGNIDGFARRIATRAKAAFLIGETASELASKLKSKNVAANIFNTLEDAVGAAYEEASAPDAIVFSPGFASQGMFENYEQRGFFFENAFLSLKTLDLPNKDKC